MRARGSTPRLARAGTTGNRPIAARAATANWWPAQAGGTWTETEGRAIQWKVVHTERARHNVTSAWRNATNGNNCCQTVCSHMVQQQIMEEIFFSGAVTHHASCVDGGRGGGQTSLVAGLFYCPLRFLVVLRSTLCGNARYKSQVIGFQTKIGWISCQGPQQYSHRIWNAYCTQGRKRVPR